MRETKKEKLTKSEQEYTKKQDSHVSIHTPVKGATIILLSCCLDSPSFNPRSREGSDF